MSHAKLKKILEAKMKQLAKLRDELRDLEDEVAQYKDVASRAYDDLENAVFTLSELV